MNIPKNPEQILSNPRFLAGAAILLGALIFQFGLEWPLLLCVLIALAALLPMPKVFSSWLSRFVVAGLFLFALLQVASLVQFLADPSGGFKVIAICLAACSVLLLACFGDDEVARSRWVMASLKDFFVLIPIVLFVLSFSSILLGHNRLEKITAMSAVQITDSVAHYGMIADFLKTQNLNYKVNGYYPSGFQLAAAYTEHSFLGDVNDRSWDTHVVVYIVQYLIMAMLMAYALLYLAYCLLEAFIAERGKVWFDYLTVAVIVGAGTVIMHLLLFVRLGFLNFFYVCASLLIAMVFLLDREVAFDPKRRAGQNSLLYAWPVCAFLFLGFGASFSWTLLVPVVLLCAALAIVPENLKLATRNIKAYMLANGGIVLFGLLNLSSLLLQYKFMKGGGREILAAGAITSFNIPFLIIGLLTTGYVVGRGMPKLSKRIVAVILPYILLITILLLAHLFLLGEARYYVVKSAILVEMFSLAIIAVSAVYWLRSSSLTKLNQFLWAASSVLFLVVGTIGLMPQPLQEARGLLRDVTNVSKPPYLDADAKIIAYLGSHNYIQNFNVSILHYDASGDRLYAHEETMLWAMAMTRAYADPAGTVAGTAKGYSCFVTQFNILAYGTGAAGEQQRLRSAVSDCIVAARANRIPYIIVTDTGSAAAVQRIFGNGAIVIAQ